MLDKIIKELIYFFILSKPCPFVPQFVKKTEGHHTGRISLNLYVDLSTNI